MVLNYIDFDGGEQNIFRNCVEKLIGRGANKMLKIIW